MLSFGQRYVPGETLESLDGPESRAAAAVGDEFIVPGSIWAQALDEGVEAHRLVTQETHDVYSFPLLNDEVCDRLCEEVEHFAASGLPARRPNSMNRYGLILNEIGLRPSLDALQREVWPVARSLWPTCLVLSARACPSYGDRAQRRRSGAGSRSMEAWRAGGS